MTTSFPRSQSALGNYQGGCDNSSNCFCRRARTPGPILEGHQGSYMKNGAMATPGNKNVSSGKRGQLPLSTATIGPLSWHNETIKEIRDSHNTVDKSDRHVDAGKAVDPLPNLRDILQRLSNDQALRYMRSVRAVVNKLREGMIDVNEEIKALMSSKSRLEKELENLRKDLRVNDESRKTRETRPPKENVEDGADNLLDAERVHIQTLIKSLEMQLRYVQQHLQDMAATRSKLHENIRDRSVVIDLIANTSMSRRNAASSFDCGRPETPEQPEPLGPFTPEAQEAMREGQAAVEKSAVLRCESRDIADRSRKLADAAHRAVNDGLTRKLAEIISLSQSLAQAIGDNRHGVNRAQKYFDETRYVYHLSQGPELYRDLTIAERLDRPFMRTYQKHPGNLQPEASNLIRQSNTLRSSMQASAQNLTELRLKQLRLRDDLANKRRAASIDAAVQRMRKRHSNHKWALGEKVAANVV